jgi:hypothetical protein
MTSKKPKGALPLFDITALDCLSPNERPPQHGWLTGHYLGHCRHCSKQFTGAKMAYTCSHCAYDFAEQLAYEKLWRDFGWAATAAYYTQHPPHVNRR